MSRAAMIRTIRLDSEAVNNVVLLRWLYLAMFG